MGYRLLLHFRLVVILSILIFSCDVGIIDADPCNAQDPESSCYLDQPDGSIQSRSDTSIKLVLDSFEASKVELERTECSLSSLSENCDASENKMVQIVDYSNEIIDSLEISLNKRYMYVIRGISTNSSDSTIKSSPSTKMFNHVLNAPGVFEKSQISSRGVSFELRYDTNPFLLDNIIELYRVKVSCPEQSYTVDFPIDNISESFSVDLEDLDPRSSCSIEVTARTNSESSFSESDSFNLSFFDIKDEVSWFHYTIDSTSFSFNIESSESLDFLIDDLSISTVDPSENEEKVFSSNQSIGSGSQVHSFALNDADINENWQVKVAWCNLGYCESKLFVVTTLPYKHMVLIQSSSASTEDFYIDQYEFTVKEESSSSVESLNLDQCNDCYPLKSKTKSQAQGYCEDRMTGFTLPSKDQWEMAANTNCPNCEGSNLFSFGNYLNPELLNSYTTGNDFNNEYPVGYFDAAGGRLKIFDMNGNLLEWTSTSNQEMQVLKGGSYQDDASNCNNDENFYRDPNASYETVGFRCSILKSEVQSQMEGN